MKPGVVYYTKKPSPVISGPARSQSEYRLQDLEKRQEQDKENIFRTESYGSTSVERKPSSQGSLDSLNAPVATPELDLDTHFSDNDGDSLMSAIVSVTAKYIDVEDPLRYHTPRRSFTIGSAAEFRKLNDSELNVEPPSNSPDNNNTMERGKVIPVDGISGIPYSNHRGAPSIDSGYLSQGSTLNRLKDLDTADKPTSSNSPERKQIRASGRVTNESEEDVPYKRIRSLSPESPVNNSTISTNINKPIVRKFSRSEFYKNKSSSPESRTRSYSEISQQQQQQDNSYTTTSSTAATTSSTKQTANSHLDYKVTSTRKTSIEPMLTSPRTTTFNSTDQLNYTNNGISVLAKEESSIIERPNTLNLNGNNTNGLELTPDSNKTCFYADNHGNIDQGETFTSLRRVDYVGKFKFPDSRTGYSSPQTKTPDSRRSLSSPMSKSPFSSDSATYKFSATSSDRVTKRVSGDLSQHKEESISSPTHEKTKEVVQWRYVQENKTLENTSESPRRKSVGNLVKVASTNISADYKERDNTAPSTPTGYKDSTKARRSSVRDVARMFNGKVTSPATTPSTETPRNRPISNPIPSKLWMSNRSSNDKRNERTKSSPNLYNRSDYATPTGKQQQRTGESVNPLLYAVQKNTNKTDETSTTTTPSYKDFDLRCRVNDGLVAQFEKSSTGDKFASHQTRSTDRLVRSSMVRDVPPKSATKGRPQSEIIQGFNFQAVENDDSEKEHPIKSSRSVYSINLRNQPFYTKPLQSSKSDNKLAYDSQDGARQIGNFPLTLKCGSAQNSRTSFEGDKLNARPVSMYDNSRASYYDNVNSIRYEML